MFKTFFALFPREEPAGDAELHLPVDPLYRRDPPVHSKHARDRIRVLEPRIRTEDHGPRDRDDGVAHDHSREQCWALRDRIRDLRQEFEFDDAVEPEPERASDGKPYLEELPSGYVVDLVVMEWLDYLVSEFGEQNAIWTVDYYEQIDWVSEPVKEQLMDYLQGFSDTERDPADVAGPVEMNIDDHIRSLTFISQITGDSAERRVVEDRAQLRGESHGLQC